MPKRDLGGGSPPALSDIAGGLAEDIQDLVRGELALARIELNRKIHEIIMATVSVAGGALIAFAGLVVILEGGAAFLAFWLPAWASLLVVGAVIILVGALVARTAFAKLSIRTLAPEHTISNLRKDARMMKDRH